MLTANQIWRNWEVDGVPSSGLHNPALIDIRAWGAWIEGIIAAFTTNGGFIYSSVTAINADLAHPANSMAWVIGDPVTANNGVYGKVGASGTGSWTRRSDLPFSFIIGADAGAGTPNALQVTTSIPVSASALVVMNVFEANTGSPVTVSFNGGSALTIKTNSGNDIVAGGLVAGMLLFGYVSGTTFRLISDQVSASIVAAAEAFANAAAGSASAAAASAAAAAASAAGVDLPPVAANRMLVDNAAGTLRESKTFSQVMTLLKSSVTVVPDGTISRSDDERTYDAINIKEFVPSSGNCSPGFATALALLATRNKIIIHVPPGDYQLDSILPLTQTATGQAIVLQGSGRGVTRLIANHSAEWVRLGHRSTAVRSEDIEVRDLSIVGNVTQADGSAAFIVEKIYQWRLRNVELIGAASDLKVGDPNLADDAQQGMVDMLYASGGKANNYRVLLQSGSILVFTDTCKFNGNGIGSGLFGQTNTVQNFDGLTVLGGTFEQQPRMLTVTGKGLVNGRFAFGISDRPSDYHVYLAPASGGGINRLSFTDWLFQSRAEVNTTRGLLLDASNAPIRAVSMLDCKHFLCGGSGVHMVDGGTYQGIDVSNNKFENVGYSGVAILRLTAGLVQAIGNQGWTDGYSGYTYGESWNGASGNRTSSGNKWLNPVSGQISGTP